MSRAVELTCLLLLLLGSAVTATEVDEPSDQLPGHEYPTSGYITLPLKSLRTPPGTELFRAELALGTPPQPMTALLDTAGNLTYMPSTQCQDAVCQQRRRYNSSLSSTYQADGAPFDVGYGTGVSGVQSRDTLSVAGASVANYTFGEATHMLADWLKYQAVDGSLSVGYGNPILERLQAAGDIERRVMGLHIGPDGADGELTLGGINSDRYSGELQFLDILPWKIWGVHVDDVAVQGLADVELCGRDGCPAAFASSSPFFIVSMEKARLLADILGAKPLAEDNIAYYLDCSRICQLPNITVTLGGRDIVMTGYDYSIVSDIPGGAQLCLSAFAANPAVEANVWAFGTRLLEKIFTVYDKENDRIGFADSKN